MRVKVKYAVKKIASAFVRIHFGTIWIKGLLNGTPPVLLQLKQGLV